jgi:hypothetical protein
MQATGAVNIVNFYLITCFLIYSTDSPTAPCLHHNFNCTEGKCLAEMQVCDGVNDCADGADEEACNECEQGTHNCSQYENCFDLKMGYMCECIAGYEKDPVDGLCYEKDPCWRSTCHQICANISNSFNCKCFPGFELVHSTHCKVTGPDPYLLFVYHGAILHFNLASNTEHAVVSNLRSPSALDYNYKEKVIYFSDNNMHKIYVAHMVHNNTVEVLIEETDIATPILGITALNLDGLAYDWIHDFLFWTARSKQTVERYDLLTKERMTLFNDSLNRPLAIAVHPFEESGYIYFTIVGSSSKVEKAMLDGKNRQILVSHDVVEPNSITLDLYRSHVYWSDSRLHYIKRMDLDGNNIKTIFVAPRIHPMALTLFDTELFWSDWSQVGIAKQNIRNGSYVFIKEGLVAGSPLAMKMVHPHQQPSLQDFSPCSVDNGGCSHLCKNVDFRAECSCPVASHLWTDGKSCLVNLTQCPTDYMFCYNGGTCVPSPTGPQCRCDKNHSGPRCQNLESWACDGRSGSCSAEESALPSTTAEYATLSLSNLLQLSPIPTSVTEFLPQTPLPITAPSQLSPAPTGVAELLPQTPLPTTAQSRPVLHKISPTFIPTQSKKEAKESTSTNEYFTAAIAVGAAGFALAVILVIALLLKKRRTKGRLVLDSASYDHFKMHNIIAE